MSDAKEKPAAGTPEFFAARQVASELMIRSLFHMHPNKALVETYLERMVGQTLVQPYFLLNPGVGTVVKETIDGFLATGAQESPGEL